MSFNCYLHGWQHLLNPCPLCHPVQTYTATGTGELKMSKEEKPKQARIWKVPLMTLIMNDNPSTPKSEVIHVREVLAQETKVGVWDEKAAIEEYDRSTNQGCYDQCLHMARWQASQQKSVAQLTPEELMQSEYVRKLVNAAISLKHRCDKQNTDIIDWDEVYYIKSAIAPFQASNSAKID